MCHHQSVGVNECDCIGGQCTKPCESMAKVMVVKVVGSGDGDGQFEGQQLV